MLLKLQLGDIKGRINSVAVVRSSESHKRSGEQRGEEDKEIELQRRKGKETLTTEFEEGELMTIELLPKQHGHMVRLGS